MSDPAGRDERRDRESEATKVDRPRSSREVAPKSGADTRDDVDRTGSTIIVPKVKGAPQSGEGGPASSSSSALDQGPRSDSGASSRLPPSSRTPRSLRSGPTSGGGPSRPPNSLRSRNFPVVGWEKYEPVDFIGEGGMGRVYKVRDPLLHRFLALKFIRDEDDRLIRRFFQEAQAQARIDHPHVCKVYEVGEVEGLPYIAMQYIEGKSLKEAIHALSVEQKVTIVRQVALALSTAHKMGIIHRDIKPSNIMVEKKDDGSWHSYVMDFGLAREMASPGESVAGLIEGTPSYMAPEQAMGDHKKMDRRVDVYSLGATLYQQLAERPPFVGDSTISVLMALEKDEPTPLRRLVPSIAEDLEIIVMKCLEKDPLHRYDSMKALAEDIERYLEGDPIAARKASLGYLALKKIRKHKALFAVSCAGAIGVAALGGLAIRARVLAAEQAELSKQVGEDVKEMELLLRWAYGLPMHNVAREKARIRDRMSEIEARIAKMGALGAGPGHYALGRGHLALHEVEQARDHLTKALAAGYGGPDVERALGRALGEIYKRELEKTNRIGEEKPREARRAAIEKEILEPALAHLRNGGGEELESAAFMEGLIAFYQKQYDVALEKARLSEEKALSTYEAKKLRADVYSALGTGKKEKGKADEALADYDKAGEAYAEARSMARSDAAVYEAECEMWAHRMEVESNSGKSPKASFEKALAACDGALVVNPESAAGHGRKAWALWQYGLFLSNTNEDPTSTLSSAIAEGQTAIGLDPSNASDHDTVGNAHVLLGFDALYHGRDPRPSFRRGCEVLEKAIALHPNFAWAQNDLGKVYIGIATYESSRGIDPRDSLRSGRPFSERAIEIDPSYTFPYTNLAASHLAQAQYELRVGEDPTEAIRRSIEVGERSLKTNATFSPTYNVLGGAALAEAQLRFSRGEPIELEIQKALAWLESGLKARSDDYDTHLGLARVYLLMAEDALSRAQGAGAALARSDAAMKEAEKTGGQDPAVALGRAQLAIVRARAITSTSKSADEARRSIEEAEAAYAAARKVGDGVWEILAAGAELSFWSACEARKQKKSAKESIRKGLAMVDEALAISAQEPALLAWKGSLSLLLSRVEQGAIAEEALRNGKTLLDGALRKNSFLVRKWKAVEAAVGER